MTRGALTTFSIANDVAKYFAILPALFAAIYPQLGVLNLMHLASPQSAILSAIVFNALIIVALIPLALRGVRYRAETATTQSLVMRSKSGTVRYVESQHQLSKLQDYSVVDYSDPTNSQQA